jgi:hypothetical protein
MFNIKFLSLFFLSLFISSCSTVNYGGTEDSVKIYVNQMAFLGTQQDSKIAGQKHCNKYSKDAEFVTSNRYLGYDLYNCVAREN